MNKLLIKNKINEIKKTGKYLNLLKGTKYTLDKKNNNNKKRLIFQSVKRN